MLFVTLEKHNVIEVTNITLHYVYINEYPN